MSLNLKKLIKVIETTHLHTNFSGEGTYGELSNDELNTLNDLPENLKKLIKKFADDQYKLGFLKGLLEYREKYGEERSGEDFE
jgi:hypothetical protein